MSIFQTTVMEFLRIHHGEDSNNNANNTGNNNANSDEEDFPYQDKSEKKRRCAECLKEGARSKSLCPLATQCQKCGEAVCSRHKVTVCRCCLEKLILERNDTDD